MKELIFAASGQTGFDAFFGKFCCTRSLKMDRIWKYFLISLFLSLSASILSEFYQQYNQPAAEGEDEGELVQLTEKIDRIEAILSKFSSMMENRHERVSKLNDQVQQFNAISKQ
jgi:hypothetical protein